MNSEKQLKRLRGTRALLHDIGILAACPRLGKALADAEEELKQQVGEDSPKSTVEENLQLLLENGWCVQVRGDDAEFYMAEARKDTKSVMARDYTMSEVLERLVKDTLPLHWAEVQTKKK